MKINYLYLFAAILLFTACKKNAYNITDRQTVDGKSLVKIGLFNMTIATTNLLIYNNGDRISGAVASPYPYPGGGFNTSGNSNGDYFAVNPGNNKFELFTTNPGTANIITKFFETTQNLEANKKYTIYTTDTAANVVAILAPDDAVAPDSGFARIRFINLIPNSNSVDFYKGTTLLKAGVAYKNFTDFFDIPASTIDTFSIRAAGAVPGPAITALAYYRLANNTNKRIYSFLCRGYLGIGGTTDLRRPQVSVSVNQ